MDKRAALKLRGTKAEVAGSNPARDLTFGGNLSIALPAFVTLESRNRSARARSAPSAVDPDAPSCPAVGG